VTFDEEAHGAAEDLNHAAWCGFGFDVCAAQCAPGFAEWHSSWTFADEPEMGVQGKGEDHGGEL
jgi:hypothetical protein